MNATVSAIHPDTSLQSLYRDRKARQAKEAFNSDTLELGFDFIDEEERIDELSATAKGRILRIVTILRRDKVRVVTAFDAPRAMKLAYMREKGVRHD